MWHFVDCPYMTPEEGSRVVSASTAKKAVNKLYESKTINIEVVTDIKKI